MGFNSGFKGLNIIKGDEILQDYNFVCWFVWVWNLVAHAEGGT